MNKSDKDKALILIEEMITGIKWYEGRALTESAHEEALDKLNDLKKMIEQQQASHE